jgi:hypothetical protein
MPTTEIIVKPTFKDVAGRFAKADQALLDIRRDELRKLGPRFVEVLRDEAPKKTGAFRQSIFYRTFQTGSDISLRTYHAEPLGKWIIGGTKPHKIQANSAGALYFFWPKIGKFVVVPKSGGFTTHVRGNKLWVGKGYVSHPGTKPNDYAGRAFVRMIDDIDETTKKMSTRYVAVLNGDVI